MATNWNAVLANINNASDILAILRKVLGLLDAKVDLTKIDEIIADISNMQTDVETALLNVNSALTDFDTEAQEAIQQVIAAGLMEGFATEAELLATRPAVLKKYAKAEDTDVIWFWNKPQGSPDGNYWTGTGLSEYNRAINYINDLTRTVESNRAQNPNKFTIEQVNYTNAPTNIIGIATYPYRNGIKQLKLVSTNTGGEIKAYWDFDAALFTREFSASVCIEGLNAGKDGLVGIQQLSASGSLIAEKYGLATAKDAITKQTIKINVAGIAAGATKIRLIVHMLTDSIREVYIHSPFIADGSNAEFLTPLIPPNLSSITGRVNFLDSAFDEVPVSDKNKFNPILASDGNTVQYTNGALAPRLDGVAFGKQLVQAGNTYTFWIPTSSDIVFFPVIYTYAANGTYLGIDHSVGGSGELVNTQDGPIVQPYLDGNRTVTFTIPVGSRVTSIQMRSDYKTHTAQQFNDLINSMQLELGSNKTSFEPFPPSGGNTKLVIKKSSLPEIAYPTNDETLVLAVDGTDAYVRTVYSDTYDLVQKIRYGLNAVWSNNVINPIDMRLIPRTTSKDATISTYPSGTQIASQGDDATPVNYNGTYIGANHGAFIVHELIVPAHGKGNVDVGSIYDYGSFKWTIVRVVADNKLWVVSQNTGNTYWQFNTTSGFLAGKTLTHVSGGTNTASFTPTGDAMTQLIPAVNNHKKRIVINGFKEITSPGVFDAKFVDFIDAYELMNPPAILAYLQAHVGTSTEQNLSVDSIISDMRISYTYRYGLNGSMSVNMQPPSRTATLFNFAGGVQAANLPYSGKTLLQYVNKVSPIVGPSKTWNFANVEDISTTIDSINFLKASWVNPDIPPDRMAQIVKNGGVKEVGQVIGYSTTRGASRTDVRKNTNDAGFIHTTRKMYPKALIGDIYPSNIMPAGTVQNLVAYRSVFNPNKLPSATVFTWYHDNNDIIIVFDTHVSGSMINLPLPQSFDGKNVTVIEKNDNVTVHSEIVCDGGVLVSVTNNYGSALIRLS